MKLLYTPIKGYVHTVEAVINYAGLRDRIEPVPTRPFEPTTPLAGANPLIKVPTLIDDDGNGIFGGPVIYEYLDSLHDRPRLHPREAPLCWRVRTQAWMADGLFDNIVLIRIETWRPRDQQRGDYLERCWLKITGTLDRMQRDVRSLQGPLTIATLRTVGALNFLTQKIGIINADSVNLDPLYRWQVGRGALAEWYEGISQAPIFNEPLIQQSDG
jgi:glutathione S-transferase